MKEPGSFADKIPEGVELNLWELQEMATRQQEQIESQQQLLVAKEQRLKYLRQQEARHHQMAAEHEKLRKLRERVEQQELKLRKLRALRGQVDNRKISNNVLSTDLETIRALFNEKEKELSVAVAKVDELTRQLEELRRGRLHQKHPPSVTIELEKLRQELMCRTKANEEKSQKISQQKEIMLQKQEEMGRVDKRINELQQRLHRKRILNKQLANQINASRLKFQNDNEKSRSVIHNNIATIEPFKHVDHNLEDHNGPLQDDFIKFRGQSKPLDELSEFMSNKNDPKYQTLPYNTKFPTNQILKNEDKFNEPISKQYPNHNNLKDSSNPTQIINYTQNQQLITNSRSSAQNLGNYNSNSYNGPYVTYNETHPTLGTRGQPVGGVTNQDVFENTQSDLLPTYEGQSYPLNSVNYNGQLNVEKPVNTVAPTSVPHRHSAIFQTTSTKIPAVQPHTLSSTPQGILQEVETSSVNRQLSDNGDPLGNSKLPKPALPPKPSMPHKPIIPPRQSHTPPPAPSNKNEANKEFVSQVNRIKGNVFKYNSKGALWDPNNPPSKGLNKDEETHSQGEFKDPYHDPQSVEEEVPEEDCGSENPEDNLSVRSDVPNVHITINRRIEMPPAFLFPEDETPPLDLLEGGKDVPDASNNNLHSSLKILAEFEKLKLDTDLGDSGEDLHKDGDIDLYMTDNNQNKIDADIEFLNSKNHEHNLESAASHTASIMPNYVQRVKKGNLKGEGSSRPGRRVSFDPLALMLDASLEGELELVKKCAKEVPNPSAANDEGITALHNAVCAGHFEIVKFLVEFGCDVNIQDSDGWTPLHCAASCNNLAMIKYLVEHGACIFATTLSDHETAAEKCEEDEEGYDGCSEYLYSIQEKLGILNNGVVYALYEYDAQNPDEMSFRNGDAIVVLRKGDEFEREWWWSKHNDQEGYVPRNLLGLYPRYKSLETVKDVS